MGIKHLNFGIKITKLTKAQQLSKYYNISVTEKFILKSGLWNLESICQKFKSHQLRLYNPKSLERLASPHSLNREVSSKLARGMSGTDEYYL